MMNWFGLGKNRSKLGKWLDRRGISQTEFAKMSGVSRPTITRLCSDDDQQPRMGTLKKIMNALRKLDKNVDVNDFFDM